MKASEARNLVEEYRKGEMERTEEIFLETYPNFFRMVESTSKEGGESVEYIFKIKGEVEGLTFHGHPKFRLIGVDHEEIVSVLMNLGYEVEVLEEHL